VAGADVAETRRISLMENSRHCGVGKGLRSTKLGPLESGVGWFNHLAFLKAVVWTKYIANEN
jgi:hypothetical protein